MDMVHTLEYEVIGGCFHKPVATLPKNDEDCFNRVMQELKDWAFAALELVVKQDGAVIFRKRILELSSNKDMWT